jgi:hypothetical protein
MSAWLSEGFNEKVLAKLREVDAARAGAEPLRIWVTGAHAEAAWRSLLPDAVLVDKAAGSVSLLLPATTLGS